MTGTVENNIDPNKEVSDESHQYMPIFSVSSSADMAHLQATLKNVRHAKCGLRPFWRRNVKMLILVGFSITMLPHARAVETIVVHGQRVPLGFYNYTSVMSDSELQLLYANYGGAQNGGMSPLQLEMYKWYNRCGSMLRIVMEDYHQCKTSVRDFHELMLGSCDAKASSSSPDISVSVGHPFLNGSVTWSAPTHVYDHCANSAANHRDQLIDQCGVGLDMAKQQESTCIGAPNW